MLEPSAEHGGDVDVQNQGYSGAPYTWVITSIDRALSGADAQTVVGPPGSAEHASLAQVIREGRWFRLVDTYGIARYGGFIVGDCAGDEPLRDYGSKRGCTRIEYEDW